MKRFSPSVGAPSFAHFALAAAASLACAAVCLGCAKEEVGDPPPKAAFHYPVSVAVASDEAGQPKTLYVASSNFDLLYNRGSVIAVDLTAMDADADEETQPLSSLIDPEQGYATTDSFAAKILLSDDGKRLFVPTRSDHRLFVLEADGGKLSCVMPDEDRAQRCHGVSLTKGDVEPTDPNAAAIHDGALYLTHGTRPNNGTSYLHSMLVRLNPETLEDISFIDIGYAPCEDIIETPAGLYFSGRAVRYGSSALRYLKNGEALDAGITLGTGIQEGRGLGLSSDGTRLYLLTRGTRSSSNVPADGPDGIAAVDISIDASTGRPKNQLLSFEPLPEGASQMAVIPREGRRDLIAVSCTESGQVVFYDDELGVMVGTVPVSSPYGIAKSKIPGADEGSSGFRLYVASFKNDSVDIIDVEDAAHPEAARKRRSLKAADKK